MLPVRKAASAGLKHDRDQPMGVLKFRHQFPSGCCWLGLPLFSIWWKYVLYRRECADMCGQISR